MKIRDLTTVEDCQRVVELEKRIWGYTDGDDVVGVPILVVTVKRGGILLGAFDDDRLVAFVYSLPGLKHGRPIQWSHMLGVLPDVREAGLGTTLKLAQRRRAMAMGIDLIEWTYDPLQALNAHLNFAKLGVIVGEYELNIYGESSSPLHRGTPTDRFVVQWWLRRAHVERRVAPGPGPGVRAADRTGAPQVNRVRMVGARLVPDGADLEVDEPGVLVRIPPGFGEMMAQAPGLALEWRMATRDIFTRLFARGYRAVDFFVDRAAGGGRYLLVKGEAAEIAAGV